MVIHKPVDINTMTDQFLGAISGCPGVRVVWVSERRGEVTFWVVTDLLDHPSELRLYEATNGLSEKIADSRWDMHLLNPAYYASGYDLRTSIPEGARRVTYQPEL